MQHVISSSKGNDFGYLHSRRVVITASLTDEFKTQIHAQFEGNLRLSRFNLASKTATDSDTKIVDSSRSACDIKAEFD